VILRPFYPLLEMTKHINTLRFVFALAILGLTTLTFGQIRSIDGTNNNLSHPEWGAVGTNQLNVVPVGFTDGISFPAGIDRPNARDISNELFEQNGLIMDQNSLSDYAWVWGQFIDHDITLVPETPLENFDIIIPTGDIHFDPQHTGQVKLHFARSAYDPLSGTSIDNFRKFPNQITAYIDGSSVYGSSKYRADWLRTFNDGKLKTSTGGYLPFNTIDGEIDGDIDSSAPEMAMANPFATNWYVAGDVRANENILLTSFHTLFVREHNRLCDQIKISNPEYIDEEIYQKARKLVGSMIQAVVYREWLPTLGIELPQYQGYNADINPGIMNVFSAAAYRYGHTVISSDILRLDAQGEEIAQGHIKLREAFFQPHVLQEGGGVDPLFRGIATQVEQDFDTKMIDDLRNFLFGAPGSGGLDLAAMNIQRGRERGLPDYNTIRAAFDLPIVEEFENISADPYLNIKFKNIFGSIDNIDPWVGFLAEDHMDYSLFGESVMKIVGQQFLNLRDGDRFYYINDTELTNDDLDLINTSFLSDIIMRNTQVTNLQHNVFIAEPMVVATKDITQVNTMEIFPNPNNGNFTVKNTGFAKINNITIVNTTGKLIYKNNNITNSENIKVNLSNNSITKGLYHIIIKTDNDIFTQRVFIAN
jgi:hypothetical protein